LDRLSRVKGTDSDSESDSDSDSCSDDEDDSHTTESEEDSIVDKEVDRGALSRAFQRTKSWLLAVQKENTGFLSEYLEGEEEHAAESDIERILTQENRAEEPARVLGAKRLRDEEEEAEPAIAGKRAKTNRRPSPSLSSPLREAAARVDLRKQLGAPTMCLARPANEELAEEIDALNAIYGSSTIALTSTPSSAAPTISSTPANSSSSGGDEEPTLPIETAVVLQVPSHDSSFLLGFDSQYPATPPRVLGTASTGSRGEGKKSADLLSACVSRVWKPGFVCLYDVIFDAMEELAGTGLASNIEPEELPEELQHDEDFEVGPDQRTTLSSDQSSLRSAVLGTYSPPAWVLSDVVTEKKSVFVARAVPVHSKEQAEKYLDYLLATEKKVAAATHNISAWRIREKKDTGDGAVATVQDFDDDGETAAGGRLLHLMQLMDVWQVLVVVSRWYGGVKLGPDRFRLINGAARDALVKGGFDRAENAGGQNKDKKKKR
jgi:hypothetical protein